MDNSASRMPAVSILEPNKHRQLPWLAVVLSLLVLSVIAALAFQNLQLKKQISSITPPLAGGSQITPASAPTADLSSETSAQEDWKTYTNTKYNYQLKYPSNYTVDRSVMTSKAPETADAITVFDKTASDPIKLPRFSVNAMQNSQESLQKQMQEHFTKIANYSIPNRQQASENFGYPVENNQVAINITKVKFQNKDSYTYTIKGNTVSDGVSTYATPLQEHKYIWVENENSVFLIIASESHPTDQILSTFKFTDPSCQVGGCSGQICQDASAEPIITTCEYLEKYSCYQKAACEKQSSGQCGWTQTAELNSCLSQF